MTFQRDLGTNWCLRHMLLVMEERSIARMAVSIALRCQFQNQQLNIAIL